MARRRFRRPLNIVNAVRTLYYAVCDALAASRSPYSINLIPTFWLDVCLLNCRHCALTASNSRAHPSLTECIAWYSINCCHRRTLFEDPAPDSFPAATTQHERAVSTGAITTACPKDLKMARIRSKMEESGRLQTKMRALLDR